MQRPKLRVIEGGLVSKERADKEFVSAFATDTRLMGEIAMGIHWHIIDHPDAEDLYQFFSFDTEECGLDNYKSVWTGDVDEIAMIRQTMIGPLGGKDVPLTEREARGLFTRYYLPAGKRIYGPETEMTDDGSNGASGQTGGQAGGQTARWQFHGDKIAAFTQGLPEYKFLIDEPVCLEPEEYEVLFDKLCTDIVSDVQLVNYYVMRSLAKDLEGKRYLSAPTNNADIDLFSDIPLVTLLKSTVHEENGRFISRSLAEYNNKYELFVTDISVDEGRVSSCTRGKGLHISNTEAALMLAHPEFITVFRLLAGPEEFEDHPLEFEYNTMITEHDNGRMYMAFNNNNDHVNDRNYMLSNDIFGVYYITRFGEFIVSAPSKEKIISLERSLLHSPMGAMMLPTGKYEFQEPVLLQFINSGIEEFGEFLEMITDPQ